MDTINYIELIEKSNRNEENIELPKSEYITPIDENIKGIMFKDKFYTKSEYEELKKQEIIKQDKPILSIDKQEEINQILTSLQLNDFISICFFYQNQIKYLQGIISKLNYDLRYLIVCEQKIQFNQFIKIKK